MSTRLRAVFDWYYIGTAFAVAGLAMIAFQAADIYQVQAFRNPVSQCARLTVAWSIVFLVLVAVVFFAQLGGMYSRLWLSSYYGIGLFTLYGTRLFLFGVVRRWTREGRLDRRAVVVGGGDPGEHLVTALERQRFRRAPRRRVRRPRRRSRPTCLRIGCSICSC